MTSQELEMMAYDRDLPHLDGSYQSCHTASVWDAKPNETFKAHELHEQVWVDYSERSQGVYHPMTDVIHKVLNDITVDDWSVIIGGDSYQNVQGLLALTRAQSPWRWPQVKRPYQFTIGEGHFGHA